jgi:hypothetical protein
MADCIPMGGEAAVVTARDRRAASRSRGGDRRRDRVATGGVEGRCGGGMRYAFPPYACCRDCGIAGNTNITTIRKSSYN